ncbi:hypothetical protein COO60DRAFT_825450 [Scenedesmus sp. NREL 46B-D3]|nr:hypothetical protein COO60DRAFT_825450 [Scenedesmus sp. NREL 46B-D3]
MVKQEQQQQQQQQQQQPAVLWQGRMWKIGCHVAHVVACDVCPAVETKPAAAAGSMLAQQQQQQQQQLLAGTARLGELPCDLLADFRSRVDKAVLWYRQTPALRRRMFWIKQPSASNKDPAAADAAGRPRTLNPAAERRQLSGFIQTLVAKERCALVKIKAGLALPAQHDHPSPDVSEAAAAAKAAIEAAAAAAAAGEPLLVLATIMRCRRWLMTGTCSWWCPAPPCAAAWGWQRLLRAARCSCWACWCLRCPRRVAKHCTAAAAAAAAGAGSRSAAVAPSRSGGGTGPVSFGRSRLLPEQYWQGQQQPQRQQQQQKSLGEQPKPQRSLN